MRAALTVQYDRPVEVVSDVDPAEPGPDQVRVRIAFCGVCHSDIHMGGRLTPLPLIAGHEAAGEIESVGPNVVTHRVGDKVVITPMPSCGKCARCTAGHPSVCLQTKGWMTGLYRDGRPPFSRQGAPVYRGNGVGAFPELVVVASDAAVRVDDNVPLDLACLIGCAVQTGVGAVLNTAAVSPGASVLVMGTGSGRAVDSPGRADCRRLSDHRQRSCRRPTRHRPGAWGDQHHRSIRRRWSKADPCSERGGVDFAFDAVGSPALIAAGVTATVPGGAVVLVGAHDGSARLDPVAAGQLVAQEKRLLGCIHGSSLSARDIPKLVKFWRGGQLDLGVMVTALVGVWAE